ncbi:MAG TPA: nucleotidyltransferase family protein [Steroidobacteraceae bacterium]|nr:nucleotidyltransferase family protein [Steroidobacteraceae bacterium]
MVLAAGRGERMRPLSDTVPKPLLQVGGRPLIAYHLEALARAGVSEAIVNLSWLGQRIREALGDGGYGLRIRYSEEGPVPLETGGGIVKALPLLGADPFIVLSADIWTDFDFGDLELSTDADAELVFVPNPPYHPHGDFALEGGRVLERASGRLTYANIGLFRAELFSGFSAGRFPLVRALERGIRTGRVRGRIHLGEWANVGTAEQLAALAERLRALT